YEKAIFYFTQSLAIQKEAEIYMLRGVCHFRKAVPDFTSAAQDFGEAQKQLPKLEELYIWRAQCFQELGDFTSAIEEYDRLVEIAPGNASHLIDRGTIKYAIDPEDAFSDFNKALEITVHPLALNNRAYYYLQQGDYDSAIEDAKMALEVDSNYSIAYATLAEIYATQGDREAFYHFLELAKQHYYEDIIDIMMEPAFAPYTAEPRFLKIIGKD
ncbi:MAG: tetratricopeptide repeat protein, partial [Bacteroidetes bacterium]|nr:tetratricopeptide repeat protein [Bacteroidota bacterium]